MLSRGLRFFASACGVTLAVASACTSPDREFFDDSAGGTAGTTGQGGSGSGKGGATSGKGGSSSGKGGNASAGDTSTGNGGAPGEGGTANEGGTAGVMPGAGGAGGSNGSVGPGVVISSASVGNGATTNKSRATFDFSDNPPGSADGYECRLDGAADFTDCSNGFDQGLLEGGLHTLEVRAYDADGPGPILERTWIVEALGTTISAIQMGSVPVDTLVTVSTNVRVTWFTSVDNQTVFIQEADYVSATSDVAYKAIMTKPRMTEASMTPGLEVSVTGSVRERNGNTSLDAAEYDRGTQSAAYNAAFFDTPAQLKNEQFEGVWATTHGTMPAFNCSSSCNMATGVCIHSCSGGCDMLGYRDVGGFNPADDAFYVGALVGTAVGQFQLWIQEYNESSDACL